MLSFYLYCVIFSAIFICVESYVIIYYTKKYNNFNIVQLQIIKYSCYFVPILSIILAIIPIINVIYAFSGFLTLIDGNRMQKAIDKMTSQLEGK